MTSKQLKKFIKYLQKSNIVIGPKKEDDNLIFDEIDDVEDIELSNSIPLHSFKRFLLPNREILSCVAGKSVMTNWKRGEIPPAPLYKSGDYGQIVLFGLTAPDLKAITILNHVFEKDPHYQNRMKNILTVGYALFPDEFNAPFAVRYEENNLEHFQFDIFIVEENRKPPLRQRRTGNQHYKPQHQNFGGGEGGEIKIFTGSEDGQKVLDDFGYSDYENVQFAGLVKEEGRNESMIKIMEAMKKLNSKSEIFKELGERCIECGRCAIICPLCYCFCLDDEVAGNKKIGKLTSPSAKTADKQPSPKGEGVVRMRNLTTCFYSEFSEVAGGRKFLNNPAERIYNWYEHKFVRFPVELSVSGCVGCGRCAKVCPVGIDIKKVISELVN